MARPAETARLAADSESHCTGRTRLGLGLRRVGETPRVSPDRPASESESDPGPGPSPIGRPYDSDSSKGHWHNPPTLLVRAAPGADSARPGESERRDARHITEISEIMISVISAIWPNISRKKNYRRPGRPGKHIKYGRGNIPNFKRVINSGLNFQRPDFTSNATHRPRRFWLAFVLFTKLLEWKN